MHEHISLLGATMTLQGMETKIPVGTGDRGRLPICCTCPQCGYTVPARPEVPCYLIRCPRCDIALVGHQGRTTGEPG